MGGWRHGSPATGKRVGVGYWGVGDAACRLTETAFFGRPVRLFEASHESAHVWSAFGLAPFADRYPCHVLVWEGQIGRFYRLDQGGRVTAYQQVIEQPGCRYQFLYALADETRSEPYAQHRPPEDAGKIMALAAFGATRAPNADEARIIEWILDCPDIIGTVKDRLTNPPFYNAGVESQRSKDLVRGVSDAIFQRFLGWARAHLEPGLPLAIGGGCGTQLRMEHRLVTIGTIFGGVRAAVRERLLCAAIGSAIQAQQVLTGRAAVKWNVYCGSVHRRHGERAAALGCDAVPLESSARRRRSSRRARRGGNAGALRDRTAGARKPLAARRSARCAHAGAAERDQAAGGLSTDRTGRHRRRRQRRSSTCHALTGTCSTSRACATGAPPGGHPR